MSKQDQETPSTTVPHLVIEVHCVHSVTSNIIDITKNKDNCVDSLRFFCLNIKIIEIKSIHLESGITNP